MQIDVFEPIRVEIENKFDPQTYQDNHTAIVYVGDIEIYREDAGYIPDPDYDDYTNSAKTRALKPLAQFLKTGIEDL